MRALAVSAPLLRQALGATPRKAPDITKQKSREKPIKTFSQEIRVERTTNSSALDKLRNSFHPEMFGSVAEKQHFPEIKIFTTYNNLCHQPVLYTMDWIVKTVLWTGPKSAVFPDWTRTTLAAQRFGSCFPS